MSALTVMVVNVGGASPVSTGPDQKRRRKKRQDRIESAGAGVVGSILITTKVSPSRSIRAFSSKKIWAKNFGNFYNTN